MLVRRACGSKFRDRTPRRRSLKVDGRVDGGACGFKFRDWGRRGEIWRSMGGLVVRHAGFKFRDWGAGAKFAGRWVALSGGFASGAHGRQRVLRFRPCGFRKFCGVFFQKLCGWSERPDDCRRARRRASVSFAPRGRRDAAAPALEDSVHDGPDEILVVQRRSQRLGGLFVVKSIALRRIWRSLTPW